MGDATCRTCPWEEVDWIEVPEGTRRKGTCSNPASPFFGEEVDEFSAASCGHSDDLCVRRLSWPDGIPMM